MGDYPVAYRSGAAKYAGPPRLSSGGPLVPSPARAAASVPVPGMDYVPGAAPLDPFNKRPVSPPAVPRVPAFIGGTAMSWGLRLAAPASLVASALPFLEPTFQAALYLMRIGERLYTPSNWTFVCGPAAMGSYTYGPDKWGQVGTCGDTYTVNPYSSHPDSASPTWNNATIFNRNTLNQYTSVKVKYKWTRNSAGTQVPDTWEQPLIVHSIWPPGYFDAPWQPIGQVGGMPPMPPYTDVPNIDGPAHDGGNGVYTIGDIIDYGRRPRSWRVPNPRPPGRGAREKKWRSRRPLQGSVYVKLGRAWGALTEASDLIDALYGALPKEKQVRVVVKRSAASGKLVRPGDPGFNAPNAEWVTPRLDTKLRQVAANWSSMRWETAAGNVVTNQLEDFVIGKTANTAQKQLNKAGWSYMAGAGMGPAL